MKNLLVAVALVAFAGQSPTTRASAQGDHAMAGSWTAQFDGRTYVRLEVKSSNGSVVGGISLGNVEVNKDGTLKQVGDAPLEDTPIFDVSATATSLHFARKDGRDTDRFEMTLSESGQAHLRFVLTDRQLKDLAGDNIPAPKPFALTRQSSSAAELVQALGQLPAAIPGGAPSTGVFPPIERRRQEIYDRLWSLGAAALPALCPGLSDRDVQVRRSVALFLGAAGGGWYDRGRPRFPIAGCAAELIRALDDSDGRVRELVAQTIPVIGASRSTAVPALIRLLGSASEGDRNTACIALAGIGPAAKDALPALKRALSDSSMDVRSFAKRAIERIERM